MRNWIDVDKELAGIDSLIDRYAALKDNVKDRHIKNSNDISFRFMDGYTQAMDVVLTDLRYRRTHLRSQMR